MKCRFGRSRAPRPGAGKSTPVTTQFYPHNVDKHTIHSTGKHISPNPSTQPYEIVANRNDRLFRSRSFYYLVPYPRIRVWKSVGGVGYVGCHRLIVCVYEEGGICSEGGAAVEARCLNFTGVRSAVFVVRWAMWLCVEKTSERHRLFWMGIRFGALRS